MITVLGLFLLVAFFAVSGVVALINRRRSHIRLKAQRAAQLEQARAQSKWAARP
jgi:hypothetical protein